MRRHDNARQNFAGIYKKERPSPFYYHDLVPCANHPTGLGKSVRGGLEQNEAKWTRSIQRIWRAV